MGVKIKISYHTEEELKNVIKLLTPAIKNYKVSKNKEGCFKKAYVSLDMTKCS